MSDPLFVYAFTTKSEINTFTFCTNIFGQICYISILNYLVKETEQEENLAGVFWTFRFTKCDKAAPPKLLIGIFLFAGY